MTHALNSVTNLYSACEPVDCCTPPGPRRSRSCSSLSEGSGDDLRQRRSSGSRGTPRILTLSTSVRRLTQPSRPLPRTQTPRLHGAVLAAQPLEHAAGRAQQEYQHRVGQWVWCVSRGRTLCPNGARAGVEKVPRVRARLTQAAARPGSQTGTSTGSFVPCSRCAQSVLSPPGSCIPLPNGAGARNAHSPSPRPAPCNAGHPPSLPLPRQRVRQARALARDPSRRRRARVGRVARWGREGC